MSKKPANQPTTQPSNYSTIPSHPNFPEMEESILNFWQKTHAFEQSVEQRDPSKSYVFYDGPPFATGLPHYGHLLASTTKDVIPRYWTMKGYRVERVWGWDCHGLPIENMIEKKLEIKGGKKGIEELGIDKFNAACRSEVMRLDTEWEKIIARLGRWVDFKNNYKTMDKTFMESVWWGFKQLYDKGLVYESKKVILYCPRCATPLSNFEIAMDNSYKEVDDFGTTYKYPVKGEPHVFLLAWSTTPWNKLATPALAVNPDLQYVQVKQGDESYILAETTLKMLKDEPYTIEKTFTGKDLENMEFEPHFDFYPNRTRDERIGVVIADNFVTAEEGTGIVTLAIYGEDDFRVMRQHHIQLVEHVNEEGRLKPEVTPWAGLDINKVNPLVNEELEKRGLVYKNEPYRHSVPTCYRCGTKLYNAPLPAWFIDVAQLREKLIQENEKINWFPAYLKHGRFLKGLQNAPDWNISRSRYWGTPMPIWGNTTGDKKQMRIIGSVEELQQWAVNPEQVANLTDIHREFLDDIEVWLDDEKTVKGKRIPEVFDCWIESGSMPFAAIHYPFTNKDKFEKNYPAQFVSEYIAQTRAWFYTMHVISVGIFGQPSFENVLTTGTILAEDGSKMSKSKKNYPDPMVVIDKYGSDALRLYLMSSTVMKGENLNFSEKEVAEIRKNVFVIWWNVFSFYMLFAGGKKVDPNFVPTSTDIMDRWMLSRTQSLIDEVSQAMDHYNVVKASRMLMEFISEVSNWYLRRSRDRLRDANNEVGHQVLGYVLATLAQLFAPFTPFFSETLWHYLVDENSSVHHTDWPEMKHELQDKQLETEMQVVRSIVEAGHAQRKEANVKVRQPLASITVKSANQLTYSQELEAVLQDELNVKAVNWQSSKSSTPTVQLELTLTPELEAEGKAREIIRTIQQLRKQAGCGINDVIEVELPEWPVAWEDEIKQKTKVSQLYHGAVAQLRKGT